MRIKLIIIILAGLGFIYSCVKKETPEEKEVKKFIEEAIDVYNLYDVDKILPYFHKKSPVYKSIKHDLQKEFSLFNRYEIHDVNTKFQFKKIRIKDDTAKVQVSGRTYFKLKIPFHDRGNLKIMLKKKNNKWIFDKAINLSNKKELTKKLFEENEEINKIKKLLDEFFRIYAKGDVEKLNKEYKLPKRVINKFRKDAKEFKKFDDFKIEYEIYDFNFEKEKVTIIGKLHLIGKRIERYSNDKLPTFILKKENGKWKVWQTI